MKTRILGKDVNLTDALKERIHERIGKLNEKYFHDSEKYHVHVTLKLNKHRNKEYIAEVIVFKDRRTFKKEISSKDMYKSIDEAFDSVDREMRKHKEKTRCKKGVSRSKLVEELTGVKNAEESQE